MPRSVAARTRDTAFYYNRHSIILPPARFGSQAPALRTKYILLLHSLYIFVHLYRVNYHAPLLPSYTRNSPPSFSRVLSSTTLISPAALSSVEIRGTKALIDSSNVATKLITVQADCQVWVEQYIKPLTPVGGHTPGMDWKANWHKVRQIHAQRLRASMPTHPDPHFRNEVYARGS